jgi:hypothetical protein
LPALLPALLLLPMLLLLLLLLLNDKVAYITLLLVERLHLNRLP